MESDFFAVELVPRAEDGNEVGGQRSEETKQGMVGGWEGKKHCNPHPFPPPVVF